MGVPHRRMLRFMTIGKLALPISFRVDSIQQ
jgi:hypothetical protein